MPLRFTLVAGLVVGCAALNSVFAADTGNAEAVMLDAVLVEASAGTPWQIVTLPEYVILSRCPKDFTLAYARGVERARRARLALLPSRFWGTLHTPMNLILYDHEPKRSEGFPLGNPLDLSWSSESVGILGEKSIRRTHPATANDGDLFVTCGNYWNVRSESADLSVDPDSELRLRNHVPQFPTWFQVGMRGQFGLYSNRIVTSGITSDTLLLPNAIWIGPAETLALERRLKEQRRRKRVETPPELLPFPELFTAAIPDKNAETWSSEAALFVRWGLFKKEADGRDHRAAFQRFVEEASRTAVTEELFRACFGLSYSEGEKTLRDYFLTAISEPIRITLPPEKESPLAIREASSSEVARIVGTWARLEARSLGPLFFDFRQECYDRAERLFRREASKRSNDASFLVEYALYSAQVGDEIKARSDLEAALAAGPIRPRAMAELARLCLNAALPAARQGFGDLRPAEFHHIVSLVAETRQQMPELLASYQVLVQAMEHAPERPAREELAPLREATELFPANSALVYNIATLYRRCGYNDDVVAIAKRAMPFATSERARNQLSSLLAQ